MSVPRSGPRSAPGSPAPARAAARNSPHLNRSFRGEKELGELSSRMRRLAPEPGHGKNRRDDRDDWSDCGDCCGGRSPAPSSPRPRPPASPSTSRPTLSVPASPRSRSKSPGGRGLMPGPTQSRPARPTSLLAPTVRRTPSPRTSGISSSPASPRGSGPAPSPASPRGPGPGPGRSPRQSPARKLSGRHASPAKPARSPGTPSTPTADLSDPEVLARIGNRAIKTVTKPTRSCDHCSRELTDDGCTAFGKVFHKECFRCHGCKKKLDGKFFSKDEKAFCGACYKAGQEQCCVCKTKITGDCVVNNNTYYHPHCMRCYVCDDPLRGSYTFFQNKPICERDFKQAQTVCSVCSETIEGTYYQLNDRIYCEQCSQSKDNCSKCGSQIDGKAVKTTGSVFHPQCFNCEVCDKSLNHKQFTLDSNNLVYCPECYTTKFAALCSVCGQGIVPREGQSKAPRIRALDRDFHPECFKCEDCGLVLDSRVKGSECWPIRQHVLCYRCYRRRQSESESDGE